MSYHQPAHKDVEHPAGQAHPGRIAQENDALHQAVARAKRPYVGAPYAVLGTFCGKPQLPFVTDLQVSSP